MRLATPALAAMVFNMEPLAVIVLATLYLGERLEMVQYAGGVCILAAILIASRQRIQQRAGPGRGKSLRSRAFKAGCVQR